MKRKNKTEIVAICVFAVIVFFVSSIAEGANWELISEDDDISIYVDNESVRHVSEIVMRAQFKIVYKEPFWLKSKSIAYNLIEQENDCSRKKYTVYELTVYFDDGTINYFKAKEEYSVKSDSFQSAIYEFICKKSK